MSDSGYYFEDFERVGDRILVGVKFEIDHGLLRHLFYPLTNELYVQGGGVCNYTDDFMLAFYKEYLKFLRSEK